MIRNNTVAICLGILVWTWAGMAGAAWAGVAAAIEPQIVVKETVYDFGRVVEGKNISHEFIIANQGNAPLEILKTKSG